MAALKPPFEATDLQGLYRKVQRGVFDRIPARYSMDLHTVISMMLKVSPALRPNSDQLLANGLVQKYIGGGKPE
jgi:NIMA (never in mitosis gene a)-related kinase